MHTEKNQEHLTPDHPVPVEIVDDYKWEKHSKILTRDVHGISGLMNFTYLSSLQAEPPTPIHYHSGILEIYCIVKGRRITRLYQEEEMRSVTCTGGEAICVFPGEYHATGSQDQQSPCEMVAIQLNLREADRFLHLDAVTGRELCHALAASPHRLVRLTSEDLRLLRQAFPLVSSQEETAKAAGIAHIVCFLYRYLRLEPVQMQSRSVDIPLRLPEDPRIRKAVEYIAQNMEESLSLETLAALAGYSLSRFKTRFREETGQTPAVYITACRIELAKSELTESEKTITRIASDLGWSSANYFCSVFKKLTGTSPLQYRHQTQRL